MKVDETSQSAVARGVGITQAAIHRYLKGVGEPSSETLQKFADYFEVPADWIRGDLDLDFEQARSEYKFRNMSEDEKNNDVRTIFNPLLGETSQGPTILDKTNYDRKTYNFLAIKKFSMEYLETITSDQALHRSLFKSFYDLDYDKRKKALQALAFSHKLKKDEGK